MGVTNYHTINGRIVGETKDGVRRHYVTDAVGSVVATLDSNGTVENTYRYKPFGALLAKTGTGEDPKFQFMGALGMRMNGLSYSEYYDREAHLDVLNGRWTTLHDSVTSTQSAYAYLFDNPTTGHGFSISMSPGVSGLFRQFYDGVIEGISGLPKSYSHCHPDSAPGVTACQSDPGQEGFGKPYSLICARGCAAPCTSKHEEVHRKQTSKCCANLAACVKKWPVDRDAQRKCREPYEKWEKENRNTFECEAYQVSCKCFKDAAGRGYGGSPAEIACCVIVLSIEMVKDCAARDKLCAKKKPVTPCPFDEKGNPRNIK